MSRVAAAYDATAPVYDEVFVEHNRLPWQEVYLSRVRPGDDVLDAGCGTGIDSVACARAGARVVGIDASAGMLEFARRRADAAGVVAAFRQGDLGDAAVWGEGNYDRVISGFAAINTVDDPPAFFAAAHRSLRPGGELLLHFLTPGGLFDRAANLSRGRVRSSFTAWKEAGREVSVGGVPLRHAMWRPDVLYAKFAARSFVLAGVRGAGVCTPDDGPSRVPAPFLPALREVDRRLGRAPLLRNLGRFGILVLRRR